MSQKEMKYQTSSVRRARIKKRSRKEGTKLNEKRKTINTKGFQIKKDR